MATIVILGASGFVGKSLSEDLCNAGHCIIGPSSRECNLLDSQSVKNYFAMINVPFFIVYSAGITRTRDNSPRSFRTNVQMVEHLCQVPPTHVSGIVYLSSTCVYGDNATLPISEETRVAPTSHYGLAKLTGEYLLKFSSLQPLATFRLPGIYGRHDKNCSAIGQMTQQIKQNNSVIVYGDGTQRRDFVSASDVARLIHAWISNPKALTINVATGRSATVLEWVALIAKNLRRQPKLEFQPQSGTSKDLLFDTTLLHCEFPLGACRTPVESISEYLTSQGRNT